MGMSEADGKLVISTVDNLTDTDLTLARSSHAGLQAASVTAAHPYALHPRLNQGGEDSSGPELKDFAGGGATGHAHVPENQE